jgi:hypothetical protein
MLSQVLLIMLGAMVLGAILVVLGLRGKRINDHPICRDCGFDLVAVPEGTITCPECGAGLRRPQAMRIGARRRRPVFLGVGAVLALLPILPLGTAGFAAISGRDLNKWKPLGLLLWEARHARGNDASKAAAELADRYGSGKLKKDQEELILAGAFHAQANESRPWVAAWGDVIEQADLRNSLNKDRLAEYRKNSVVLDWKVRPRVRVGDPLPVRIAVREKRAGPSANFLCMAALKEAKLGEKKLSRTNSRFEGPAGVSVDLGRQLAWFYITGAKSPWQYGGQDTASFLLRLPPDLAPGHHTIEVVVVTKTEPQSRNMRWSSASGVPKGPSVKEHRASLNLEVLPKDAAVVRKIPADAEKTKELEVALIPRETQSYGPAMVQQQFSLEGVRVPVAYEVVWKHGTHETAVGAFASGEGAVGNNWYAGPGQDKTRHLYSQRSWSAPTMDVVLRPSEQAVLCTIDQFEYYDHELVMEGVSVEANQSQMTVSPAAGLVRGLQAIFGR